MPLSPYVHSYISTAKKIIEVYDGAVPFAAWLKVFFKEHKKHGSKDRKHITHLCYCFFRLGHSFKNLSFDEQLTLGLFLCSPEKNDLLAGLNENWNNNSHLTIEEKLNKIGTATSIDAIFGWNEELSNGIDRQDFNKSFLIQPDLFLRIRPGKEKEVKGTLYNQGIPFIEAGENCIDLASTTKIDAVLAIDKDVVIQDKNSQKVLHPLKAKISTATQLNVWDCCAASGGKSILLMDTFKRVNLTVSDVRPSILINLKNRFRKAGLHYYKWFVGDAGKVQLAGKGLFDVIICDAPCSGSGTWSRTPESLCFFKKDTIDYYATVQKKIIGNICNYLKPGGFLVYSTCSVFKKENEDVVVFAEKNLSLESQESVYYKGYQQKADTLFTALFTRL